MPILGWRVHFTRRQLPTPGTPRLTLKGLPEGVIAGWLDAGGIEDGVPFLISPDGHYDIDLNAYFSVCALRMAKMRSCLPTWMVS